MSDCVVRNRYEMPSNAGSDTPGMTFLEVYPNVDTLCYGTSLALCTCSITLSKEVGDIDDARGPRFAVMPAAAVRWASLHFCNCFLRYHMPYPYACHPRVSDVLCRLCRQSSKKHHLIYDCRTFSGDCGSALVLHNGMLVGLHVSEGEQSSPSNCSDQRSASHVSQLCHERGVQHGHVCSGDQTHGVAAFCRRLENVTCPMQVMGVNQLKERISHAHTLDERLTVVEASLDSAVASVASGAIALLAGKMV